MRFDQGQRIATPGALAAFRRNGADIWPLLERHACGDWGEVGPEDRRANEVAARCGGRLLSSYHLDDGTVVWIITEADHSATTVLLPEEY